MRDSKIYVDCYQATLHVFHRTKAFPKALRPTLGRRIEESCLNCLLGVRKASVTKAQTRLKHLQFASESLDELRTLVQLAKDLNAINVAGLSELSKATQEIGREIGGFIKHERTFVPS
ncbi:MAG: four helix bundle protein [Nitrosomonas ureae]